MDDKQAIEQCKAGQTAAFGCLVEKYQSEATGHAVALAGNTEDALDVVQDAFLDAFKTLDKFDVLCRFYPWLYTIIRNRCFKLLASRRKRADVDVNELKILARPTEDKLSQQTAVVEQSLFALSPEDREILTLKHLDGLSYEELAERLGIPCGTVMSRLYYARKRFREKVIGFQQNLTQGDR